MRRDRRGATVRDAAVRLTLVTLGCLLAAASPAAGATAPVPTNDTIRVFSDQLPDGLSPALLSFAATHYAGAQKLGASETVALKARNPSFFMI